MSVLDRSALESSPLADLHAIATELGLDGYRRLRKAELIDALVARQGGDPSEPAGEIAQEAVEKPAPRRRRSRAAAKPDPEAESAPDAAAPVGAAAVLDMPAVDDTPDEDGDEDGAPRRRRGRRGGRSRAKGADAEPAGVPAVAAPDTDDDEDADEPRSGERASESVVEGVVELMPNGSGFLRIDGEDEEDVYISAAQVKRCELVAGDRVAGPRRAPRRSERYPSLIRIDAINGIPASEAAAGTRFDDLPAAFPSQRLVLGTEDPTVKAIEWLTPLGKGSRVTVTGPARAGKTEALMRLARALAAEESLAVHVVLAGARPEELGEWRELGELAGSAALGSSADTLTQVVEQAVDHAKRLAARGSDVVLVIDGLDGMTHGAARRALAAARDLVDSGSLTVIAAAERPVGGETTVIALDRRLAATGRFPALDLAESGTIRPELLVGEAGAEAIAGARAEAYGLV